MRPLLVALALLAALHARAAERVEIFFDVPAGLESYAGRQPVTFGVPFPKGALLKSHGARVVNEAGQPQPAQFEVTATWTAKGDEVRWLLVDAMADVRAGKAARAFLEFGPDVAPALGAAAPLAREAAPAEIGAFELRDGEGRVFRAAAEGEGRPAVERSGAVRKVVRSEGRYVTADGVSVADFQTRVRTYPGCEFSRVYHTVTWQTNDAVKLGAVAFTPAGQAPGARLVVGVDGRAMPADPAGKLSLRQKAPGALEGDFKGAKWEGWVRGEAVGGGLFAAVRWPWQQSPSGVSASNGVFSLHLLDPSPAMSLKPLDVAVPPVLLNVKSWNLRIFKGGMFGGDVIYNGPPALEHLTPRGVAKTWEVLLWKVGAGAPPPEAMNALAQHPVLAHADPAFATKAALPSPMSPRDPKAFPEVEAALERAFGFYARALADEGDFGVWNWGDLQWDWSEKGHAIYRYWMNHGKGWSILPWALWLRSGDRRYWENGEANSRHCMDVDTCHVRGWERDPNDFRLRGGQYHYSAIHWGYGPEVFTYYVDSEYLPYAWYMTGYERARDVMLEHAEAMGRYPNRQAVLEHFRKDLAANVSRHTTVMVKNLCVLYEATWDERLAGFARDLLAVMKEAQMPTGNFPNVKTNHYLDEPLLIAIRALGWEPAGPMLQRWHECLGDPLRPGPAGNVNGPMSLWSSVVLHEKTGDARWLDAAVRTMNSQAASVAASGDRWDGLNNIPPHEAGPALRDWPAVMQALLKLPAEQRPTGLRPIEAFHSMIKPTPEMQKDGWGMRHLAYALCEDGKDFDLALTFAQQPETWAMRVLRPDKGVALEETGTLPAEKMAYDKVGVKRKVPAGGQKGAFAIEVRAKFRPDMPTTLFLRSGAGKLVHWLGGPQCNLFTSAYAGSFWFKPAGTGEASLSIMNQLDMVGRTIALGPDGRVVGESRVTGSKPVKPAKDPASIAAELPAGDDCRFTPAAAAAGQLHAFHLAGEHKPNRFWVLKGVQPWVSATREEWFDPSASGGVVPEEVLGLGVSGPAK
jgi:hypothetical protein